MGNENSEAQGSSKRNKRESLKHDNSNGRNQGLSISQASSGPASSARNVGNKNKAKKPDKPPERKIDVPQLSDELSKLLKRGKQQGFAVKKPVVECQNKHISSEISNPDPSLNNVSTPKPCDPQKFKAVLEECLQNLSQSRQWKPSISDTLCLSNLDNFKLTCNAGAKAGSGSPPMGRVLYQAEGEGNGNASLLRSYLSGSNPTREEYISKRRNASNSLISSDSIHHSIFLESGRERRQCLLQYLSKVVSDGQVVIYANTQIGVESLMTFLRKHGFQVNMVHPRMLLAESNWILSEFSLNKFSVLLCAEDHYHSCPAHFRWVKTVINYELPISNPLENWMIRNGIVEFSDNLPVHIYTFIKKSCPLDNELVKLLYLDLNDHEEQPFPALTEHLYSVK